jgi:hypothetical protein
MASLPVRDPVGDHLLTPQNSALVVIDYQRSQFASKRTAGAVGRGRHLPRHRGRTDQRAVGLMAAFASHEGAFTLSWEG